MSHLQLDLDNFHVRGHTCRGINAACRMCAHQSMIRAKSRVRPFAGKLQDSLQGPVVAMVPRPAMLQQAWVQWQMWCSWVPEQRLQLFLLEAAALGCQTQRYDLPVDLMNILSNRIQTIAEACYI